MNDAQKAFYHLAIIIGAKLAAADGKPEASELIALKNFFQIDTRELPEAARLYNGELHNPKPLEETLAPFVSFFCNTPQVAESFLFGMCNVALADGAIHSAEVQLLTRVSDLIGITRETRDRIFMTSGITKPQRQEDPHSDFGDEKWTREKALGVLGLLSNASEQEITSEYRRLAKRYHPDVLRSQNLPEAEMRHAERLLRDINDAYNTLKNSL